MNEQARRYTPPKRVRYPTDRQFASGCSPPRLTTTQLPSATEFVTYSDTDFHRADVRHHGRTHSRGGGNPGVPGMARTQEVQVLYRPRAIGTVRLGKGVHREVESEGSR
jgi:hypothetical protein